MSYIGLEDFEKLIVLFYSPQRTEPCLFSLANFSANHDVYYYSIVKPTANHYVRKKVN